MQPYIKKIVLVLSLLLTYTGFAQAQNCGPEESNFSTYYYQRKSLFKVLPNTANEIIFLGDSITDGNNWSELFGNPLVKNRGISGDVTQGVLCRMEEVLESDPAKIFIMIGINDLGAGRSVQYVLTNYEKILQAIQKESPKTQIYIQSLLPVNPDFGMFAGHMKAMDEIPVVNKGLKKLAENYDATYINLYAGFTTEKGKLKPKFTNDGLHLKGAGYLKWKKMIDQYISN